MIKSEDIGADVDAVKAMIGFGPAPDSVLDTRDADRLRQLELDVRLAGRDGIPEQTAVQLLGWVGREHRTRRRRLLILGAAPGALLLTAAGAAVALRTASQTTEGVGCYERASLSSSVDVVATTGDDPVALCAEDWAHGPLRSQLTTGEDVPTLSACVLPHGGAVGVFPTTSCAALHLQSLPIDYGKQAQRMAGLINELRDTFASRDCYPVAQAVAGTRTVLSRRGFGDWSVTTVRGADPDAPCASFSPDSERHTILVTGEFPPRLQSDVQKALEAGRTCKAGTEPTSLTSAQSAIRGALRGTRYASWNIRAGQATTAAQPCYSADVDLGSHTITLSTFAR
jgi:hypothetical protein